MVKKTSTGTSQKATKAKTSTTKPPAELPSTDDWQKMLDDMGSESNDPRQYYIKQGRNRVRLMPENGDPKRFYIQFSRTYQGQVRSKYLLRGIVLGKDNDNVVAIPVGKAVIKSILNLLAEGYDLFDPKEGLGISIVRSGSGLETSYMVLPSPKPVPVPKGYKELKDSLETIAQDITEADEEREKDGASGGKKKRSLGRKKSEEASDDEEGW